MNPPTNNQLPRSNVGVYKYPNTNNTKLDPMYQILPILHKAQIMISISE